MGVITEAVIKAATGGQLAFIAFKLGLTPETHTVSYGVVITAEGHLWEPHNTMDEAQAVFWSLRDSGTLTQTWINTRPEGSQGEVEYISEATRIAMYYGSAPRSERLALLRVACLAKLHLMR